MDRQELGKQALMVWRLRGIEVSEGTEVLGSRLSFVENGGAKTMYQ